MFSFGKLNVYIRHIANIKIDLAVGKCCVVIKAYAYVSSRTHDFILRQITELQYRDFSTRKLALTSQISKRGRRKWSINKMNFLGRRNKCYSKRFVFYKLFIFGSYTYNIF